MLGFQYSMAFPAAMSISWRRISDMVLKRRSSSFFVLSGTPAAHQAAETHCISATQTLQRQRKREIHIFIDQSLPENAISP